MLNVKCGLLNGKYSIASATCWKHCRMFDVELGRCWTLTNVHWNSVLSVVNNVYLYRRNSCFDSIPEGVFSASKHPCSRSTNTWISMHQSRWNKSEPKCSTTKCWRIQPIWGIVQIILRGTSKKKSGQLRWAETETRSTRTWRARPRKGWLHHCNPMYVLVI